jgi:cytochrome b involved in lipid metabolism
MQNQNKNLLIVVAVLVVLLIAGVMYLGKIQNETYSEPINTKAPQSATPGTASSSSATTTTVMSYTAEEVALHNNKSSCWTIVNGKVYDVTSFTGKHPGGEKAVLRLCGTDGTANFMSQHGGKKGPESTLAKFEIGTLK